MPGILHQHLFHKCMKIVLNPTTLECCQYHIVPGPDGLLCLMMTIMMAWVADLEEQLVIVGARSYSCPVCMTSHQDLDSWGGAVNHTPQTTEATLTETNHICQLFTGASLYEFKVQVQKDNSGLSGVIKDFCWEGLPVKPSVFITQDLLHGCYKFVWDHVAKWLSHLIGEEELDHHFYAQPNLRFQNFSQLILKISQATGQEHQTYL